MINKLIYPVLTMIAAGALTLMAEESPSQTPAAMLTLQNKNYSLKRVLAYETMANREDAIAIVFSAQAISPEKLKEARDEEKEGGDAIFNRPFLKLLFTKTGEFKYWSAAAGGTSIGRSRDNVTGELKTQDGRAIGKATQPLNKEAMFPSSFDLQFDVPLLKAGDSLPASTAKKGGPAADVKPTVSGVFKGNGKDAKLAYVSARWGEPFSGKAGIVLIFTEKDHSKARKPDFDASFGKFGSALIISLFEDGQIYSCQVAHSAHQKQGFSSTGNIEATDFAYGAGKVEGEITTSGQLDTFGETWEVDLKFVAPLGEIPKELQPAPEKKEPEKEEKTASTKSSDDEADDDSDNEPSTHPGDGIKAKDLALTTDATDVEYKKLVGYIAFKSKSDVKSVCAELAKNLKAQGWTTDGHDMVQPQSSILRRKRAAATLTIFVKPESGGGSEVKLMTVGLSWE